MFRSQFFILFCLLTCFAPFAAAFQDQPASLGQFEQHSDVGTVLHPGSAAYDPATKTYTVAGSGENMWSTADDFQFIWKKASGDLSLSADVSLLGSGGDNHRKAVLMIRQSLDADSPYADAAVHGSGLTSLQFRDEKGAMTHEIESDVSAPKRLRIEKRGDRFYLWIAREGEELHFAGGSTSVALTPPFYIGIGVCAHNKDNMQKAAFSNVDLASSPETYSTVETITVASTDARVRSVSREHLGGQNWGPDAGPSHPADEKQLPNDEFDNVEPRLSPDEKQIAFLSYSKAAAAASGNFDIMLRVLTLSGNKVKILAKFFGNRESLGAQPWSPDSRQLTFTSYQRIP
ncbi:MAG: hypothetical protein M3Y57_11935 [Acidobacteriota bacterium]|nr:hypothetical protein [Acidobacteriota bacterium]